MTEFKLVNSATLPLTRDLVEQFRTMEPSPTERSLDPKRVRHLLEKAEAGQLVTFNWAKAKVGGKEVRMNGQHSSEMLAGLNGKFPEGLVVHMDEYEVDNPEGLAVLFRQYDDRKSGRSPSDVSGAYQGLYPALHDVPRDAAKLAIEGVTWYRRTIEGLPSATGDDQYALFAETGLHGFIQWIGELFSIKTPELKKPQVVSAIYATFIMNEVDAREFWEHVARGGVEYQESHPASMLSDWLLKAKKGEMKEPPKAAHYYQAAIYAWNAHREGKEFKTINVDKMKSMLEPIH